MNILGCICHVKWNASIFLWNRAVFGHSSKQVDTHTLTHTNAPFDPGGALWMPAALFSTLAKAEESEK